MERDWVDDRRGPADALVSGVVISIVENLVAGMQFYGRARPSAEIRELNDQCLIYCGLNYAAFNAAVLRAPMVLHPRELMRLIEEAREFYEPRGVRWTYWLSEASLGPELNLNSIFTRYGLRALTEAPGMIADSLLPCPPLVDLRPVLDKATRGAFGRLISTTFDIPQAVCTAIYESERAWGGDVRGYVGYVA